MTVASFTSCYDKAYFMYFPYQPWCLAADGSIAISVEGGVAPYTWAISGSAFTLAHAETADQDNTINAESDAVNGDEETITITDACGTEVTGIVRCCDSTDCCVNPDYAFTRPNEDVYVGVGVYTQVHVQGGCPPYTWVMSDVSPSKVTVRDTPTNSNFNMFKFASDAAADETLTVTDGCDEVVTVNLIPGSNPCNVLYYVVPSWNSENSETLAKEDDMTITIDDGTGPFVWEVSGTGFSLVSAETETGSNTLEADATACGTATVVVTDTCGEVVTDYVRCTTGQWAHKDDDCDLSVVGDYTYSAPYHYFEAIVGNVKENIEVSGGAAAGGGTSNCEAQGVIDAIESDCNKHGYAACGQSISDPAILGGLLCTCIVVGEDSVKWYYIRSVLHYEWEC